MFYVVTRSVVTLKPKQPFLDWVNSTLAADNGTLLDLISIRQGCNSYLIPEVEELEDGIAYVDETYESLFQLELSSWSEDDTLWPKEMSLKMFWEWFDVEISPTLIDMNDSELERSHAIDTVDTIH